MHSCPDCGQACYCHGDIDDCEVETREYSAALCDHDCEHYYDDDFDDGYDDDTDYEEINREAYEEYRRADKAARERGE